MKRTFSVTVTGDPDNPINVTKLIDEEGHIAFEVSVPAGQVDYNIPGYALTDAKLSSFILTVTGHNGTVTVETNSGSAAQDTFTAGAPDVAGQSVLAALWFSGMGANPIAGNITGWYVTNPGTTPAVVRMEALQNAP